METANLEYTFPEYPALTEADLAGKTRAEIKELDEQYTFYQHEIETFFNTNFCRAKEYSAAYYKALKPIKDSFALIVKAYEPGYIQSCLEEREWAFTVLTVA